MVKTLLAILLLCSFGIPAWAMPPSDNSATSAAAQDATGTVWGLRVDNDGNLSRWQAGVWAAQAVPGTDGFRLRVLTRGDDGCVYAFWQGPYPGQNQTSQCLVTVHRGVGSRILARFSASVVRDIGFPSVPTLYAGAGGDVWLAGYQPLLWHISPDGSVTPFPLKPEQYFGGKLPEGYQSQTIDSVMDGAGRRWFWQDGERGRWQPGNLRGVLIWDGKTLAYHPTLAGVPDRPFSVIAPLDANHFWLATGDDYSHGPVTHGALYRVDTRALSAVPETPQRDAFQNIAQIFQANGDWYAVEPGQFGSRAVLWRERAGQWRPCLNGLEEIGGGYTPDLRHPWLSEPSGVWLGVSGGAWWLPRSGQPPIWVNWRRGLATLRVSGLFPLTDGSILAFSGQGAAEMPPTPQPIRPLPPGLVTGGMGAPKNLGPLLADPRHHLWGERIYTQTPSLDEWDGKHWQAHPMPKSIPGLGGLYACDTMGRLWLTTSNWHPPAQPQPIEGRAVYDPAHDTWTKYDTVPDALQAAALLPGMGFLPYRNTYQPPLFSGDGRVTYAYITTVYYYDGHTWRHWEARGILPGYSYGNLPYPPHFNQDGHLEIVMNNQRCQWTPDSGWQQTGEQKPAPYQDPMPPGGPRGLWAVPIVDSLGQNWFTWEGAVYTEWHGLWAKQDDLSGPNSPFGDGRVIEDVLRDPAGRLFFVTRPADYYDLVWSPPAPKVTLAIVPIADDSVVARAQASPRGPHWFLWRLNGGAWSAPQTTDTMRLTALPRGNYRVEIQAMDRRLQPSAPAAAAFSIRVAPGAQIARWVSALLHGTEDAREAAVAGLIKQPDAALPALQAARPAASEDGRWWLDAAMQQIMDERN